MSKCRRYKLKASKTTAERAARLLFKRRFFLAEHAGALQAPQRGLSLCRQESFLPPKDPFRQIRKTAAAAVCALRWRPAGGQAPGLPGGSGGAGHGIGAGHGGGGFVPAGREVLGRPVRGERGSGSPSRMVAGCFHSILAGSNGRSQVGSAVELRSGTKTRLGAAAGWYCPEHRPHRHRAPPAGKRRLVHQAAGGRADAHPWSRN